MRLFEILLLVVTIPVILWPLLPMRRSAWLDLLPFCGLLFILLHLLFEGYRWQMIPGYGETAVLSLISLRHLQKRGWRLAGEDAQPTRSKLRSRLLGLCGLLWLVIAFALPLLLPVPKLIPKTGPYAVGTNTLHLVDTSREEIYTPESGDPREFMVQFWYPAAPTGTEAKALFQPDLAIAGPVIAAQFDFPAFMLDHINLTDLDIWQDPPVANGGPFPVIIFAHGLTGVRQQNTSMAQELASHGYIVAAIDHTYGNALSVFPDGRVILYDPCRLFTNCSANYVEARPLVQQWAGDIAFLLDTMSKWDETTSGIFAGQLDLEHVGVFGHSTGGGAAVQFCMDDPRCDAGLGLDAWVLPVTERVLETPPTQPFMFISTPRWLGEENQAYGRSLLNALPADGYELTLADTSHYDFSDLVLLSPLSQQLGLSGGINSQYSLSIQSKYVLAFFDKYVRMQDSGFLSQSSPYPELTMQQR